MSTFIVIFAIAVGLSTIVIMISLMYTAFRYAPFVPTQSRVVKQMVKAAELKDGQVVVDLGCGDGRLLIEALKEKKVQATGIEASFFVWMLARLKKLISRKTYKLLHSDFFQADLSNSDVVFCYLFPNIMLKLKEKFEKELKEGTKVISYSFPIKAWQPIRTIQTKDKKPKNFLVYVYEIGKSYE